MRGLIAKKVGMTQVFNADGGLIPVTLLEAGPCIVTQIKTVLTAGYNAVQVGYDIIAAPKLTTPELKQPPLKKPILKTAPLKGRPEERFFRVLGFSCA